MSSAWRTLKGRGYVLRIHTAHDEIEVYVSEGAARHGRIRTRTLPLAGAVNVTLRFVVSNAVIASAALVAFVTAAAGSYATPAGSAIGYPWALLLPDPDPVGFHLEDAGRCRAEMIVREPTAVAPKHSRPEQNELRVVRERVIRRAAASRLVIKEPAHLGGCPFDGICVPPVRDLPGRLVRKSEDVARSATVQDMVPRVAVEVARPVIRVRSLGLENVDLRRQGARV